MALNGWPRAGVNIKGERWNVHHDTSVGQRKNQLGILTTEKIQTIQYCKLKPEPNVEWIFKAKETFFQQIILVPFFSSWQKFQIRRSFKVIGLHTTHAGNLQSDVITMGVLLEEGWRRILQAYLGNLRHFYGQPNKAL